MTQSVLLTIVLVLHIFVFLSILASRSSVFARQRVTFSSFVLSTALWIASILITELFKESRIIALYSSRLSFFTGVLGGFSLYLFSKSFELSKDSHDRYGFLTISFSVVVAMVLTFTDLIVAEVFITSEGVLVTNFGSIYPLYGLYMVVLIGLSVYRFLRFIRNAKEKKLKFQLLLILIGLGLSIGGSLITNFAFPLIGSVEIRFLGPMMMIFFLYFSFLAIRGYEFLHIQLVSSKWIYLVFVGFVPIIFFYVFYYLQIIVWGDVLRGEAFVFGALLSILFIVFIAVIREKLEVTLSGATLFMDKNSKKNVVVKLSDVKFVLKHYHSPNELSRSKLIKTRKIQVVAIQQEESPEEVLRELVSEIIESFRPLNIRRRSKAVLKYEILKLMAMEGMTESQIMWELGFDIHIRRAQEQTISKQEPRYKFQNAGDYAATSARSFKRLKKQSIEMFLWKLQERLKGGF